LQLYESMDVTVVKSGGDKIAMTGKP
jgi:hypothetical protein